MQMPPCMYVMTQMYSCVYAMMQMSMSICHDANALTQTQFIQKFPLFSKSRLPQRLKPKIFSNLDLLFLEKSSSYFFYFFFGLKAPKKLVITVRNLRIGHLLEI